MGKGMRAQAHLPVHTIPELRQPPFFFHGTLRPHTNTAYEGRGQNGMG